MSNSQKVNIEKTLFFLVGLQRILGFSVFVLADWLFSVTSLRISLSA